MTGRSYSMGWRSHWPFNGGKGVTCAGVIAGLLLQIVLIGGLPTISRGETEMVTVGQWTSEELYDASTSNGVMLTGDGIVLEDRVLVEDDAPAFGFSVVGNSEILGGDVVLRKELIVDRWPIPAAHIVMLVYPDKPAEPNNGRHLLFRVNGNEDVEYEVNHFWTSAEVPVEHLKRGINQIEVRVKEPDASFRTLIALEDKFAQGSPTGEGAPERSSRSTDGGEAWTSEGLGIENNRRGEYPIRLSLRAHGEIGTLESPVIDVGGSLSRYGIAQSVAITDRELIVESKTPEETYIEIEYRLGLSPWSEQGEWLDWRIYSRENFGSERPDMRYAQFRVRLRSDRGDRTPVVESATLRAVVSPVAPGVLDGIHVHEFVHRPAKRSSFDFPMEDSSHPALKELRERHGLDEVVAEAQTEFEKILLLKSWVARQWDWYLPGSDYADFRAWDARKVLEPDDPNQPKGGYCLQYAIVFMQACQSFGIPARVVSANYSIWGGHEMTEVWSNDYGKWILMDAQFDTVFVDKNTGIPMSALELHEAFMAIYYPDGEMLDRDNWPREDMVRRSMMWSREDLPMTAMIGGGGRSGTLGDYDWWRPTVDLFAYCGGYGMFNLGHIRFLPRSNFLSDPLPMPLNHGLGSHWGWDGYLCWYSEQVPRSQEHRIFTNRSRDLYWNVNCVEMAVTASESGVLDVELRTTSPNFELYRIEVNGTTMETAESRLSWPLLKGLNRLEARVVDKMGNVGPPSVIALSWFE